jgi:hypothetical protein
MPIDAMDQHPYVSSGEDNQSGGASKTTKYQSCYINYLSSYGSLNQDNTKSNAT